MYINTYWLSIICNIVYNIYLEYIKCSWWATSSPCKRLLQPVQPGQWPGLTNISVSCTGYVPSRPAVTPRESLRTPQSPDPTAHSALSHQFTKTFLNISMEVSSFTFIYIHMYTRGHSVKKVFSERSAMDRRYFLDEILEYLHGYWSFSGYVLFNFLILIYYKF